MGYMLDTNICIYLMKDKNIHKTNILNRFKMYEDDVFISAVTLAELERGVAKSVYIERNSLVLQKFLTSVKILSFDSRAALYYGKLTACLEKNGAQIGKMDSLIAAHALSENMTIVTNNVREFQRVPKLHVEDWN